MTSYESILLISLFAMTVLTRAVPFFFAKKLQGPPAFQAIGRELPAYIMLLLVIYEVKPESFLQPPYAIPAIIALGILTGVHVLKRSVLLSIAAGTSSYMLMLYFLSS